jgi:hypothetical protein
MTGEAMQHFLDLSQSPSKTEASFRSTPGYIEVEFREPTPPPRVMRAYVMPWRENALLVVAYISADQLGDLMQQQLQDPKLGDLYYKEYKKTWPKLMALVENSLSNQISKGVLLNIEDPDTGDRKWVVATVVGNVRLESDEEMNAVMRSERMLKAIELVVDTGWKMLAEVQTNKISTMSYVRMAALGGLRGAMSGYKQGHDLASLWVPRLTEFVNAMK